MSHQLNVLHESKILNIGSTGRDIRQLGKGLGSKSLTTMMDESSYAEALDALHFDEHSTRMHCYDSNQEGKGVSDMNIFILYIIV